MLEIPHGRIQVNFLQARRIIRRYKTISRSTSICRSHFADKIATMSVYSHIPNVARVYCSAAHRIIWIIMCGDATKRLLWMYLYIRAATLRDQEWIMKYSIFDVFLCWYVRWLHWAWRVHFRKIPIHTSYIQPIGETK